MTTKKDRLEIKVEKFKNIGEQILRLRNCAYDLNLEYSYANKEIKKRIDESMKRFEKELKRITKKLPIFTEKEFGLITSHDRKYIYYYLRVCPFCRSYIGHFNAEMMCDNCSYLFYSE